MNHLVLFRAGRRILAAALGEIPKAFAWEGTVFLRLRGHLGDFNHLLDQGEQRVGYEFPFATTFGIGLRHYPFIKADNAEFEDHTLRINFSDRPIHSLQTDCCQAMGTDVFESALGDIIIVVPTLEGWSGIESRTLAISLELASFPKSVN